MDIGQLSKFRALYRAGSLTAAEFNEACSKIVADDPGWRASERGRDEEPAEREGMSRPS
jgi:hypothetical protein